MSEKRYVVRLTEDERSQLRTLVETQRVAARKRARAQVLLKVDAGDDGPAWTDAAAAAAAEVHVNTVGAIRRRLVEGGVPAALEDRPRPPTSFARKLTATVEREVLAVAQSAPPAGRARWTLHLVAAQLVQLEVIDAISHETVRKALQKTTSSPTSRSGG